MRKELNLGTQEDLEHCWKEFGNTMRAWSTAGRSLEFGVWEAMC